MMKKRLLALLMAAVMTISLLPTTAWAHDCLLYTSDAADD